MNGKLIWLILALAFLIRIIAIGSFPVGFNADESSFGYDAYSLLKTGRDQWGVSAPLVLKSFGDFKSPLYSYLSVPFVSLFGLNIFSVRLVSAFVGTLAVLSTYLLTKRLSGSYGLGLTAALFLALNPWSIMLSRAAAEANLITFFLPMALYMFLEKKYSWSAFFFGLNLFTYHSAKLITPVVLGGLLVIYKDRFKNINIKNIILPLIVFTMFLGGLVYTFKIGGGTRITERSIVQGALEQGFDERIAAISKGKNHKISKLLHNRYQVIAKRFINNYSQYFSFRFLTSSGAGEGSYSMIPGIGVLNFFELVCIFGLIPFFLVKNNYKKLVMALITWLIVAPLPAALASGIGYSGNRASGMLPVIQIIAAFGALGWFLLIKTRKSRNVIYISAFVFSLLFVSNSYSFINKYFKTPDSNILRQMGYGNLEVGNWLNSNTKQSNIILSRSLSEPQIFIAFASRMDPYVYQSSALGWDLKSNNAIWVDQLPSYNLDRYTIKSIDWEKDFVGTNILVSRAEEVPVNVTPIKVFYYPNGTPNIFIIDSSQKIYAKAY
jgi:4-amino-4-deoxy-L-arabinose transferase-like glycosyltransferase